jgi:hypothetical protein
MQEGSVFQEQIAAKAQFGISQAEIPGLFRILEVSTPIFLKKTTKRTLKPLGQV